jgi:hypothetical protein
MVQDLDLSRAKCQTSGDQQQKKKENFEAAFKHIPSLGTGRFGSRPTTPSLYSPARGLKTEEPDDLLQR